MVQNLLHFSWDKAETFLALSYLIFLNSSLDSLYFSQLRRSFLFHAVLNDVCCENNKCIRCSRMTSALPKKTKKTKRGHLLFWVPSDSKLWRGLNVERASHVQVKTQRCGKLDPKSVWEYKDIIKQPKMYNEGVLAKKKEFFQYCKFP